MLGSSRDHAVRFGEDAVTSAVVLGLKEWGPPGVRIVDARSREHEHGADVELWLQLDGAWHGYVIQAKKATVRKGRGVYESLGHRVGGVRQVDLLMTYARLHGLVPLYAFFNFDEAMPTAWVPRTTCCSAWTEPLAGCTVVPATLVAHALTTRGGRSVRWLHRAGHAQAARCALCRCGTVGSMGVVANIVGLKALPERVRKLVMESEVHEEGGWPSASDPDDAALPGPAFMVVAPQSPDFPLEIL